jgi:hypothetical protein
MVEGFDYGDSADAAMSDDLERENSRLRAQEDDEQLDTSPWLARIGKHASCLESAPIRTCRITCGIDRQVP